MKRTLKKPRLPTSTTALALAFAALPVPCPRRPKTS